jgi:hypothetical protein
MEEREAIRKLLREDSYGAQVLKRGVQSGKIKCVDEMELEPGEKAVILVGPDASINGSKQVRCSCNKIAWISPSTQAMMKEKGEDNFIYLCTSCLPEFVANMEKEQKAKGSPQ